jgi:hypothetical protein
MAPLPAKHSKDRVQALRALVGSLKIIFLVAGKQLRRYRIQSESRQNDRNRHRQSDKNRRELTETQRRYRRSQNVILWQKKIIGVQTRENPAIAGWVPRSGGCTEGLLGGWLAQRQAALREVMAAGALPTFTLGLPCVPEFSRAACVPRKIFSGKQKALSVMSAP